MLAITRSMLWVGAIAATCALALAYRATGLTIAPAATAIYLAMLTVMILVAAARPHVTTSRERRLADVIELTGMFCWVSLLGALASYTVASHSIGFEDEVLARADAALRFDWPAAYRIVADRPWLSGIAGLAYRSIFLTPLVVVATLAWSGRTAEATQFIALFALALAIALLCFHFWPARSALAHFIGTDADYLPATGIEHVAVIEGLRSGAVTAVDPGKIVGLITFPSFHAVSAVLFTWAGWPVRGLRAPLLVVNGTMLLATPVEGTHYLIDVIAGIGLAFAVIAFAIVSRRTRAGWRAIGNPAAA